MASGDLIVRVRMADVQKFVADAGRCRRPPTRSAGPGSAPGRSGVRRIRSPGEVPRGAAAHRVPGRRGSMTAMSALVIKNALSYNAAFQSAETSFTTLWDPPGAPRR